MAISERDQKFMREVAAYFESTKTDTEPEGSIRETALRFGLNRAKVRKILVTEGMLSLPITEEALRLRERGLTVGEIAAELGLSPATVSTYLPYADKLDGALDPSPHAAKVREYRAYEKQQLKRQAARKESVPAERSKAADGIDTDKFKARRREKPMDDAWKKEWEKDKKMSYTETYHRPHRETWEDAEKTRKELGLDGDPDLRDWMAQLENRRAEQGAEWRELREKTNLSDAEGERLSAFSHELGRFPGALNDRDKASLERLSGEKLPFSPTGVMRLHLELCDPYRPEAGFDEETIEILRRYGEVERGTTISRDIIVPSDLPLYALHYVIQRAFGWQNAHLHQFELPPERAKELCHDNASMWSCLVGLIFRSPLMGEEDEFWTDDYMGGSFKNWLRKKYTGPYLSLNHGEGLLPCQEDMMRLDMKQAFYVCYTKTERPGTDGEEYISNVVPAQDRQGRKRNPPKSADRVECLRFEQLPTACFGRLFDRDPLALIERLPVDSVLAAGRDRLGDLDEQEICRTGEQMYEAVGKYVDAIVERQEDTPEAQVCPLPFTDVLYYTYDFGDDWTVRITASWNCEDLTDRLSRDELDKAQIKCRELYRPVLIARDGSFVMDDVGGIHGFTAFLQTIHPELDGLDKEQKARAKQEKKEYLDWARGQGWKKDDAANRNLL